jgi:hypothetical protein
MGTNRITWILGALVAMSLACGSGDDDKGKPDSGVGPDRGAAAVDQGGEPDTGGGTTDIGGATADGSGGGSNVGKACQNPDGNTHTDCTGDTDYCTPNEAGVEMSGLTKLTCTKKGCDPKDAATCPAGLTCMEIPAFVIGMMKAKGVNMPATICGKK